jgi:hypothetical protein
LARDASFVIRASSFVIPSSEDGMTFANGVFLVVGIFVGVAGIAGVRWLVLRRIQRHLAAGLIEELNSFNGQIRRMNERLGELAKSIESRTQKGETPRQAELGETLSEMNRLLREIHEFFSREEAAALEGSDFLTPEEADRFRRMKEISSEELSKANWDDLLDKLREDDK